MFKLWAFSHLKFQASDKTLKIIWLIFSICEQKLCISGLITSENLQATFNYWEQEYKVWVKINTPRTLKYLDSSGRLAKKLL